MKRKIVPPVRYDPVFSSGQSDFLGYASKKKSGDVMTELSSFYDTEEDEYEPTEEEEDDDSGRQGVITHRRLFGFASPPVEEWPEREFWENSGVIKYVEAKDGDGMRYYRHYEGTHDYPIIPEFPP